MALITPDKLAELLQTLPQSSPGAVLLFGDAYLCRQALHKLESALLTAGAVIHPIDGEEENFQETRNSLATFSLFGGRQIYRITDSTLLAAKAASKDQWAKVQKARESGQEEGLRRALSAFVRSAALTPEENLLTGMSAEDWQKTFDFERPAGSLDWTRSVLQALASRSSGASAGEDPGEQLAALLQKGLPSQNMLILLSSTVDKRKKLFKYLKEHELVIDCSVPEGAGTQAKNAQDAVLRNLAASLLQEGGKQLDNQNLSVLLDRIGFHPAALENELWKLMLFVGEAPRITRQDLDTLVGRTKEEEAYALSDPIIRGDLPGALIALANLLEDGVFYLIPFAILRNTVRKMLLFRALMDSGEAGLGPRTSYQDFQKKVARLREEETWGALLDGHPYALYRQCSAAGRLPLARLLFWMRLLMEAELRLKGSAVSPALVLHRLVVSMLQSGPEQPSTLAKSSSRITISA